MEVETVMYRELIELKPATLRKNPHMTIVTDYILICVGMCVSLFLQGGYATYRYAQPAAATAAAYSDR